MTRSTTFVRRVGCLSVVFSLLAGCAEIEEALDKYLDEREAAQSSSSQSSASSDSGDEPIHYVPESEFPERVELAEPLAFPLSGSVGGGNYSLEYAFPALEEVLVATVGMAHDGISDHLYALGMTGVIHRFPNHQDVATDEVSVFLDLTDRVYSDFNELGLWGLAFDPDYAGNGYFYVFYMSNSVRTQGGDWNDTVIERWRVDPDNPDRALADSGELILSIPQQGAHHKGGTLAFGPDGNLYASIGDGAWAATYQDNNSGQETDNLRGTVIRIRPTTDEQAGYTIPVDNPFVGDPAVLDEIYAYGFRNPYRFDIDPYDGSLWLGDVGQQESNGEAFAFEEVNHIRPADAGGNYGWPICEGPMNRGSMGGPGTGELDCAVDFREPVYAYQHDGASASIIGGVLSASPSLPGLQGQFIFGDYNRGFIRAYDPASDSVTDVIGPGQLNHISGFGRDRNGENYVIAFNYPGNGPSGIYRLVEDDLAPVEFPAHLSTTGLYADTAAFEWAEGVMPYALNADMWADGAQLLHKIVLPAGEQIHYADADTWQLPPGSALIKHVTIPTDADGGVRHVNTAVLFRQNDGWAALNYEWNLAQTDATLVTASRNVTLETFFDGTSQPMTRSVQSAEGCATCHSGLKPLAFNAGQFNRMVDYDHGWLNQLEEWHRLGLFDTAPYDPNRLVRPDDTNADIGDRARAYLATNCAHCHASSGGLDLRLETPLADTGLFAATAGAGSAGLVPFMPEASGIYLRQVSDQGRMPMGSRYTNPLADALFHDWIRGHDAELTAVSLSADSLVLEPGDSAEVLVRYHYSNGFDGPVTPDDIDWWSDDPAVASVNRHSDGSATIVAEGTGSTDVYAMVWGQDNQRVSVTVNEEAEFESLSIFPNPVRLDGEQQLVLMGHRADGSKVGLTALADWQIDAEAVATLSEQGLLTQSGEGEATVTVNYNGLSTSAEINTAGVPGDIHIRFDNHQEWDSVYIHVWDDDLNHPYGMWPGNVMTGPDDDGYWHFVVAQDDQQNGSINFLFHNNAGLQTGDLNSQASVSYDDGEPSAWHPQPSGPELGRHRLTLLGAASDPADLDIDAGTKVAISANHPPLGMTFERWLGDAAPYLVQSDEESTVWLVMPNRPALLQAEYRTADGEEDLHAEGRGHYQDGCASCHGDEGEGGVAQALNDLHLNGSFDHAGLAAYISAYMPVGNVDQCSGTGAGDCAYEVAAMILANAWQPPSGCDGDDCGLAGEPEPRNLRLLTQEEYFNSVSDLFAVDFDPELMSPVPRDGLSQNFNTASFLIADNDRARAYQAVAVSVAEQALAAHGFFGLAQNCGSSVECVLEDLGLRVFRRPLSEAEVDAYAGLYESDDGGQTVVEALLLSPHFLYRSELGQPEEDSDYYRLSAYEIAALLSYTFWATTPDAELLAAAGTPDFDVRTQVERLLDDPRAERGLRRFVSGWLIHSQYDFPAIDSTALAEAMNEETVRFVLDAIEHNRPYRHLLTADYSIVNQALAEHYGMAPVEAGEWATRQYTDERTGLLGHSSFLASRAGTTNPSPIKRGVYVREVLLCQEFPTPAAADFNIDRSPEDSNRDAVSRHTSDPSCASCHQYIDGVGFGLERFGSDALFRSMEQLGTGDWVPVLSDGEINSLFAPETLLESDAHTGFQSLPELANLIADSPLSAACYSRQFFRYVAGRKELPEDEATIVGYSQDLRDGGGLRDLLIDLTLTDTFVLRR